MSKIQPTLRLSRVTITHTKRDLEFYRSAPPRVIHNTLRVKVSKSPNMRIVDMFVAAVKRHAQAA